MSLSRYFRGVPDSIKMLPEHWHGDIETGFPAQIKAVREDGLSLCYLPGDEVEHERDRARYREERLTRLIHDMYRTIKSEDRRRYEDRMEALGIEVSDA